MSTLVDGLSIIAVVGTLLFAGLELRQFRKSRERESALELFNAFQTYEFTKGYRAITRLPDNQSKKQIEDLLGERMDDLYFVAGIFEGLGVLVYRKELSLEMVEDFLSGNIILTWLKLRRFIEEDRKILGRDTWMEWTQWLAERIMERESTKSPIPAYIEYQDWEPD